jgi:hypothetical protein
MQGPLENILTCTDKNNGFKNKIQLWKDVVKNGSLEMFSRCCSLNLKKELPELVDQHLCMLERKLHHYFELTETKKFDWVRNPLHLH